MRMNTESQKQGWLNRNVVAIGLTSLFSDASHEMATAILPFFLLSLGAGPDILGFIEGFSDGASSFVKSFAGYLSDKTQKRKPIMNAGYTLTAIFIPLLAVATSWYQVFALRVSAWMGRGARGPPRDALLSDSVPLEKTGKAFGFHRAMDTTGAVIGPASALVFLTFLSYRQIFVISAIPGLATVFVVLFLVHEVRKKPLPSTPVLSTQGDIVVKDKGFVASVKALPYSFKLFLVGVGIFGLGNFANSFFTLRAQQVLAPKTGALEASIIAVGLYILLNATYAITSFPVGALSDRIGRKKNSCSRLFYHSYNLLRNRLSHIRFLSAGPYFSSGRSLQRNHRYRGRNCGIRSFAGGVQRDWFWRITNCQRHW